MAKRKSFNRGEKYLGQTDSAKYIGIHPNTFVMYYIKSGSMPYIEIGKRKVFDIVDLERERKLYLKYHPDKDKPGKKIQGGKGNGRGKVLSRRKVE